jgi:hypothetical protein
MKATTIKLEGELLCELEATKPESVSLSAFVREVLRKDLQRRKLSRAAVSYEKFLAENPEEQLLLREWDEADLTRTPKRKRR